MSIWTHVAGCIRYDGIFNEPSVESLKELIGPTCSFEDPYEKWEACRVPCGSEGSVEYKILTNPEPNQLARYVMVFWGDLRDYEDLSEIETWFKKISTHERFPTRNAVVSAKVEGGNELLLSINWEDENG